MMNEDEDDALGIDLDAWQPPPPPGGLADRVIDRVRGEATAVTAPVVPVEPERAPARRRWWLAGAFGAAAALAGVVAFATTRPPESGQGALVAERPSHVELGPSSAELDARTVVSWRRDRHRITAQQSGGAATWRVHEDDTLTIETALGSIEATNASLRVEVKMLDDKKTIALSAVTAAAVALVTIVVYEGVVKVTAEGATTPIAPGTTYQIKAKGQNVIEQEQLAVGASPQIQALDAEIARKRAELGDIEKEKQALDRLREELDAKQAEIDKLQGARPPSADDLQDSLDRAAIQRVMKGLAPKIKACAQDYRGYVSAAVRVAPNGSVERVVVVPANTKASACIVAMIRPARFDATKGGTTFKYPFTFAAGVATVPLAQPSTCDADKLVQRGQEMFSQGNNAAALGEFEQAYRCRADRNTLKLVFASACKAKNVAKARVYWTKLPQELRDALVQFCVGNGITTDQLGDRRDPFEASDEGRLTVTNSAPATVLVDGEEVGTTPVDVALSAGKHKVTLVVGADKHTFVVSVKAGETVRLAKQLE